MAETRQELLDKLTQARKQLAVSQNRVTELESLLTEDQTTSRTLLESEGQEHALGSSLERSDAGIHLLVEAVEDYAIYLLDTRGNVASWNVGAERLKGYQRDEIIGQSYSRFFTLVDQQNDKPQSLLSAAESHGRVEDEGWRLRKDGSQFWANVVITALRNKDGSLSGFAKITRDLTQRKLAENRIRQLHRTLGVLSDINQAIVRIHHLPTLFEKACEIAVDRGTFRMAWIGLLEPGTGHINPVARAGVSDSYLETLDIGLSKDTQVQNPLTNALRTGLRWLCNDLENDPQMLSLPWRDHALRLGYRAAIVLPLIVTGEVRGIFNLYSDEPDFFDAEELQLMDEMAMDISHAMEIVEQDEQRTLAEAAVKRYAKRMEILHQIDTGIISARSIQEVIEGALKNIRQLIPCQRVTVILFDWVTNEWLIFADDANHRYSLGREIRTPIPPGWDDGFGTETTRILDDLRLAQPQLPHYQPLIKDGLVSGIQSLFVVQEQRIGLLGLNADTTDFFTPEHKEIATQIASQLAIAIRQFHMSEELARHAAELEQRVVERTAALSDAKERVEAILNNSVDGILLVHPDLAIQQTNSSFNRLFACLPDDYFGKSVITLGFTENADQLANIFETGDAEHPAKSIEFRAVRRDGTVFDAELSSGHIKGDGMVCTVRNITEQKAQERQLHYYASVQQSVVDSVIVTDTEYCIQTWNPGAERTYGWTADEAIGKSAPDLLQIRHPLTQDATSARKRFIEQGFLQQETIQRRKDGTDIHILGSATMLSDENGKPVGIVSVNQDISERKEMERQLRYHASLQENVSDAVIVTDMEFGIQSWNRAAERIYGWRAEEVVGKATVEILKTQYSSPDDRQLSIQQLREQGWWQGEVTQYRKDGSTRQILGSVTLIKDEGGAPVSVVSVNHDITQRKRDEATLQAKMEEERQFQTNLKALHEIIIELTGIEELDTFYKRVVELGLERLGFERLAMFLYDEHDSAAVGTFGTDSQGNLADERSTRFQPDPDGIMRRSFERTERFSFREQATLYNDEQPVGTGWNVAAILWNGTRSLGWLIADNLLSSRPASKPLLDILGLYALSVGTLLAQKQTQLALRESETLYRLLADNISDLIMRSTLTSECLYISPAVHTILGYTPAELIGQQTSDLIYPDDLTTIWDAYSSALERNDLISPHQYRARHKAGHYVWLETVGRPLYAEGSGAVLGVITSSRDITERKRAEDALRESEEKFRLLMEAAPIAIVITNEPGQITLVNNQAEMIFGYHRAELVGHPVDMLLPDVVRDRHIDNRATYLTAPRVRQMGSGLELAARRKDASEFPVEIELSYIKTQTGVLVMSFVVDITERKRVAAELERQRSFLRSVIDVSPSMIFVKDYDARFVLVNPLVASMYNTTPEALIGNTDADFNPSAQEVNNFLEADRQVIDSGELLFIEEPITNIEGETHWLQTTKVPIVSEDGKSKFVLGISTDITDRKRAEVALKESEAKYRSLIETMRGGLVIFDLDNRITFINDQFCELLGYSRDEVLGTRAVDYVDAANLPTLAAQLARRRLSESSTYELLFRHKNGSSVHLLVSDSPLLGKNGEYNGSFAVTTDITAQKQAEEVLRQALAKEKELGELKSRFVSMASHEFRTPLATILALTETLSAYRHKLPEDQIEGKLDKIKDQVSHLNDIMEDVLLLARMQARRVDFKPVLLDLDALCRSVLDEYQSRPNATYRLEYTCSPGVHEVKLDRKLMRQIISNLVSNAIKYSPEGKLIQVSLEFVEQLLDIKVRDEGIGIPEADLTHLFEPFHRAANVGAIPGTGLGLVITKESVELHNGTIAVESQAGVGTTFTIHIPIATEEGNNDDSNIGH